MHKKILTLDASGENSSIALLNDDNVDFVLKKYSSNDHNEKILSMIKYILLRNNVRINELHAIAFSKGPGKFTGLRITSGIAQGLSLVFNIPLIGISTLSILAEKAWRKKKNTHVITILHAKTNKVYWAQYIRNYQNNWCLKQKESIIEVNTINCKLNSLKGSWLITGNKYLLETVIKHNNRNLYLKFFYTKYFNAKDMIPIALSSLKSQYFLNINQATPIYLE